MAPLKWRVLGAVYMLGEATSDKIQSVTGGNIKSVTAQLRYFILSGRIVDTGKRVAGRKHVYAYGDTDAPNGTYGLRGNG